ncbi:hypothetical protein [Paenibacillus polymyxa]|uniref:hypothetical protein n=1 Tax=Paenibacillus polymyxa TaxID=1406 RepID=UPI002AB3BBD0|nr:hypothetical protein [Paenibacillus polymyxa]MDY8023390.1 hypothetical protein [Paenibacillus polymyxa]
MNIIDKNKVMKFNVQIEDIKKVNSLFSQCKIRVLYTGLNRNNAYIAEETVEEAASTIFNTPIIGEYNKDTENFGGHGGKIDVSGNKPEYVETTMPYGVVPESATLYWEEVEDSNGNLKKYFIVDGGYLWTDRYPEVSDLLKHEYNQSMEIKIIEGKFSNIDGKKVHVIEKFVFTGFCILGINKETDPNGHVEPCFEDASIVAYSLINDEFKNDFNNMVSELKFSLQGGKSLNKKKFALTASQLLSEAERELTSMGSYTDEYWGFEIQNYYLVDVDSESSNIIAFDNKNRYLVGLSFSVEGDKINLDQESIKRFKVDYAPMEVDAESNFTLNSFNNFAKTVQENTENSVKTEYENKVVEIENKFNLLQQEYDDINSKYTQKLSDERVEAESQLFESFSSELSEDEMKSIKDNKSKFSLEDIENRLYALVGKKKTQFSHQSNRMPLIPITNDEDKHRSSGKIYDDLFD